MKVFQPALRRLDVVEALEVKLNDEHLGYLQNGTYDINGTVIDVYVEDKIKNMINNYLTTSIIPEIVEDGVLGYIVNTKKGNEDSYLFVPVKHFKAVFDIPSSEDMLSGLSLSEAVELAKKGYLITRLAWNGNKLNNEIRMYVIYVPESECDECREGSPYREAGLIKTTIHGHLDLVTPAGTVQPGWLAAQPDIIAKDWVAFKIKK